MKKMILSILLIGLIGVLAACGGKDKAGDDKTIKFGATAGPYSDMITKAIKPGLEKKGYKVELTEFGDYVQPNNALNDNSINVNMFQHTLYLDNFSEQNNMDLSVLISIPTAPLGIYSNKFDSLEEIEDGSKITMPNDPVNAARTLLVLQGLGLIEIDGTIDPIKASEKDVVVNPKNLVFQPIEAAMLPRSIESSDLAAIPGNFAIAAKMSLLDALALEQLSPDFQNVVAIRTEDKDQQFVKDIQETVESAEFKEITDKEFAGFGKPDWMN
ncbi:MetQ/NlpA family ABC transporter substrate-binding protein [Sporosarcina sp. CAU 1771]